MLSALRCNPADAPWPGENLIDEKNPRPHLHGMARRRPRRAPPHRHPSRLRHPPPRSSFPPSPPPPINRGTASSSWTATKIPGPRPFPRTRISLIPPAPASIATARTRPSSSPPTTSAPLEQAHFLDLVENCRGPIAFAGVLLGHGESTDHAQPNEWVLRALLETAADDEFAPDLWAAASQAFPPAPSPALDPAEHAHLETVHAARHNPALPFDRYQFNFNEAKLEPGAWPATALDSAVTCPATFALKEFLGAESIAGWTPARQESVAVGTRAHIWLGRILGLGDRFAPAGSDRDDAPKLARELAAARRELEEWYRAEGLALPLWWESCLRKTAWATRRCLREVRGALAGGYCAMEQKLAVHVGTPSGSLPITGRIDIVISDRPSLTDARVRMFDFKTGRAQTPSVSTLHSGSGAQFAAYYLMARDAGAAEAAIGVIKPEERAREVFDVDDESALRAHFALLADLRRTRRFGRRGPLVTEFGICETLPLATVPIDPAILDQKAALFLIADPTASSTGASAA